MVAEVNDEDWFLSDTDEESALVALMAKEEQASSSDAKPAGSSTFEDDMKWADKASQSGTWNPSTMYKVSNFITYTDEEKMKMFTFLTNDLQLAFDKRVALENEVMKLKQTILEKIV